jgi:hypothetical protein
MKRIILEISDKLRNGEITEKEAQTELCVLFNVSDSYSDNDVRNIALEMSNEAVRGLYKEQRWDMQKRLGKIKDKWKLNYR